MNRAEITGRVVSHLHEEASPVRWAADEIVRYVQDGYEDLSEMAEMLVETETITVGPGEHFVSLGSRTIYVLGAVDVTLPGQRFTIDPVHWTYIAFMDPHFETAERVRPAMFAAFGLGKILLDAAYTSTGSLEVTSVVVPPDLGAGDTPAIQSEFHDALVEYGIFRCNLKGVVRGEDLGRAMRHRKFFAEGAGRLLGYGFQKHGQISRAMFGEPKRMP